MGCRIKREDEVIVISGKAKGQKGKVVRVLKKKDRIIIEGVNKAKKHEKPNPKNDRAASDIMAFATCTVEITKIGDRQFGNI